jgi:hypothetical protein
MFSVASFGGNSLISAIEDMGIKPAKATKGLPNQLSPSQDSGSLTNLTINFAV